AASAVQTAGVFAPSAAASLGGASAAFGKHMPSLKRSFGSQVAVFAQPPVRSMAARTALEVLLMDFMALPSDFGDGANTAVRFTARHVSDCGFERRDDPKHRFRVGDLS